MTHVHVQLAGQPHWIVLTVAPQQLAFPVFVIWLSSP